MFDMVSIYCRLPGIMITFGAVESVEWIFYALIVLMVLILHTDIITQKKIENGTHDVDHMHEWYTVDIMSYFLFN